MYLKLTETNVKAMECYSFRFSEHRDYYIREECVPYIVLRVGSRPRAVRWPRRPASARAAVSRVARTTSASVVLPLQQYVDTT